MELFRYNLYFFISMIALAGIIFLFSRLEKGRSAIARRVLGRLAASLPSGVRIRRMLRLVFCGIALFLLISAACVPQWGVELAPVTDLRGSIVVAIDVSLSMAAKDLKPSRLDHARMLLNDISERFAEYRMGIVAFSGRAYMQCPLTDDAEAIKYFSSQLKPGMLPLQGTDFASAIMQSIAMTEHLSGTRVLIMITDGEDHSKEVDMALKEAQTAGMRIFPVGMGSPEGELIPITDSSGRPTGFKKDRNGKPVLSRLDEQTLMKIAAATGSAYVRYVSPDSASEALLSSINRLELEKTKGNGRAAFKNRYQWPLSLAFLFLLLELLLMDMPVFSGLNIRMFGKGASMVAFIALAHILLLPSAVLSAESAKSYAREGNSLYRAEKFEEAAEKYSKASELAPKDARMQYNLGVAQYKNGEYAKAKETFDEIDNKKLAVKTEFNKANALYKAKDLKGAIAGWKKVLRMDPGNTDAKFNLQKAINEPETPGGQGKDNKNDDKNSQQDKKEGDKNDNNKGQGQGNNSKDNKSDNKNKNNQDKQDKGKPEDKSGEQDGGAKNEKQRREQEKQQQKEKEQAMQLLNMMSEKEKSDAEKQQAEARRLNARHQQAMQPEEDW